MPLDIPRIKALLEKNKTIPDTPEGEPLKIESARLEGRIRSEAAAGGSSMRDSKNDTRDRDRIKTEIIRLNLNNLYMRNPDQFRDELLFLQVQQAHLEAEIISVQSEIEALRIKIGNSKKGFSGLSYNPRANAAAVHELDTTLYDYETRLLRILEQIAIYKQIQDSPGASAPGGGGNRSDPFPSAVAGAGVAPSVSRITEGGRRTARRKRSNKKHTKRNKRNKRRS